MIKCKVKVRQQDGKEHIYTGVFRTTCDATLDAFAKFGICKVQVIALGRNADRGR